MNKFNLKFLNSTVLQNETNTTQFSKDELQAILKFGAEELFKEDNEKNHSNEVFNII